MNQLRLINMFVPEETLSNASKRNGKIAETKENENRWKKLSIEQRKEKRII